MSVSQGDQISGPCREKYWEELSPGQQIERVRSVAIQLARQLSEANKNIAQLLRHQHGQSGELLVAVRDTGANEPIGYHYDAARQLLTGPERR